MTAKEFVRQQYREMRERERRARLCVRVLDGIPTEELEAIANASGDAARLAQLGNAIDEAYQRARGPK